MSDALFRQPFQVRDHECDLQGIVNNAVYQNYLEHARHEYLRSRGVDFAALTAEGVHLVMVRAELDYRRSLRPGDHFTVDVRCESLGRVRHVFLQEIVRADGTPILSARIVWTVLDRSGRPRMPAGLLERILPPAEESAGA
jgi:acyl-CoA thioester hydrolase